MADVQSQENMQTQSSSATAASGGQPGGDPLSHLYKMSTTSAAGAEYVAINPTSIASLILGVASVLALLSDILLVIPLAGIICGIVALVQISRSNGTQTGRAFAIGGLVLAALIGGARGSQQVIESSRNSKDTGQIAAIIQKFGQGVHAHRYDEIYEDLTTNSFREQVDKKTFAAGFQQLESLYGAIDSIEWNGERMDITEVGSSGVRGAFAMGFIKFHNSKTPGRPVFGLTDRDGSWKIDSCTVFPEKKKKKALQ